MPVGRPQLLDLQYYVTAFSEWTEKYDKKYESSEEQTERLGIFIRNLQYIMEANSMKGRSFQLGLNAFSDLTFEEFRDRYLITKPQNCSATSAGPAHRGSGKLPTAVDWRQKHVITPVKNQGACGSCWTFSTTGAVEAHHAIKTGKLISLSEQQLVDCAQAFNNHGCNGGLPSQAFEYIHYNKGIEGEVDYPYKAHDEKCRFDPSKVRATVEKSFNITMFDEQGIGDAVAVNGPVSIAFEVIADFQHYKSGVYSSTTCKDQPENVNHAVLVVGYNVTSTGDHYWIVKNSWGPDWGNHGYFWIERGKNMCGLASCASYPIV